MAKKKTLAQAFALALRTARQKSGMTQEQTAELLKLSLRQYNNLERSISTPRAETAVRIYRLFGINLYELDFDLSDKA